MLILSRRLNESLSIGKDIDVTILGIRGQRVRMGVSTDPNEQIDIVTCSTDESIDIGEDVKITILSFSGHSIRMGIDAPKSMAIQRDNIKKVK